MRPVVLVPLKLEVALRLPENLCVEEIAKAREVYGAYLFRRAMAELDRAAKELEEEK